MTCVIHAADRDVAIQDGAIAAFARPAPRARRSTRAASTSCPA